MDRRDQELDILAQVSQILGDGIELPQVFQRAMTLLSERLGVIRASLVLWDQASEQLRIVAAVGLTPEEMARGRYALGEGVTGQVLASGKAAVIADVSRHPDFLNRTGARPVGGAAPGSGVPAGGQLSYICVPVKDGDQYVGCIAIDKPFVDAETLDADARLMKIMAGSFGQAIRIHNLMQVEKDQWLAENQQLRDNLRSKYRFDNIIGSSPVMLDVLATIGQVASSRATVLLLGETGCGKELIAKAIHYNSPRRDKALIRVNCGALSPQLLESELFGHVKGAFTGAVKDKVGRFEAADGGTIFLDEVGTLSTELQVKLLRVLQERELERVGDHHTVKVDVRVIAATNLDLEEEVRKGTFREDLYYRLNVVTINLPPLRSRREDIPRLIDFFLDRYNRENGRNLCKISREVLNTLLRYPWPGNVRELENIVERLVVLAPRDEITLEDLPSHLRATPAVEDVIPLPAGGLNLEAIEKELILKALKKFDWNQTQAARYLDISRKALAYRMEKHGIPRGAAEPGEPD